MQCWRKFAKNRFKAIVMGGYGVAASMLGEPDVGYLSMTEMASRLKEICDAWTFLFWPMAILDISNPLSVQRTVREFEKRSAAAMFLEDQEWLNAVGIWKETCYPMQEHVQKIKAAVDARQNRFSHHGTH